MLQIVYIAAAPRSGTTLLGNILGSLPSVAHVGELDLVWRNPQDYDERLCGCGHPLAICPFWNDALDVARSFHSQVDVSGHYNQVLAWERRIAHGAAPSAQEQVYLESITEMYRRVTEASGARVIVDSSKRPHYGACLRRIPSADVRVLHLVRDPRAFVYSRQSRLKAARPDGRFALDMPRAALDLYRWRRINREAAGLARRGASMRVQYERLMADPERVLGEIAAFSNLEVDGLGQGGAVDLATSHTFKGNKNRFQTGEVRLAEDLRWERELTPLSEGALRVLAAPLLAWPLALEAAG
ncbi:sulfotransferase family protein [Rubricoccus marinus]|uniref:Sulfotransferase family protein n=1 Tax=Rubricoccus marinus TaxID=716817 RepID=A0A259TVE7_9BACT|nr:sulfotransferase [Rubricoccus marinus]OZC01739.1 hypothetical protein BSZ36_01305 [Rubricoccus marinus]